MFYMTSFFTIDKVKRRKLLGIAVCFFLSYPDLLLFWQVFFLPGMVVYFLVPYPVFCSNLSLSGVQRFIFFSYTQFYSHFDKIFSFFRVWWLILPSHTRFCSIIFLLPGYSDSVLSLIPILLTKMYISAPALVLSSAQYLCNFLIRKLKKLHFRYI